MERRWLTAEDGVLEFVDTTEVIMAALAGSGQRFDGPWDFPAGTSYPTFPVEEPWALVKALHWALRHGDRVLPELAFAPYCGPPELWL
jgi:hypothetical protein